MVSAIKCLKVGGELVYSTCSVAPEENELMVEKIIRKYPVEVVKINPSIHSHFDHGLSSYNNSTISGEPQKAIRIWPHVHHLEGFFVIKLKKTAIIDNENEQIAVDMIYTQPANNPQIKEVLNQIGESWGITEQYWEQFRYILTKTRLWMLSPIIDSVPSDNFVSGGLLLGEERLNGWKLVNGSVQHIGKHITKRRIAFSDEEMKRLFQEGKIKYKILPDDYYVLDYEGRSIGSLYHEKGTLRIRLPHLFTRFRI